MAGRKVDRSWMAGRTLQKEPKVDSGTPYSKILLPEGMLRVLLCISRYLTFVPQGSLGKTSHLFYYKRPT
jgi:hypothetical protein